MNKQELVSKISEKTSYTKKDVGIVVDALMEVIKETLSKGEKVQLVGFGNFEVRERSARKGRNPKTGETIIIPASKSVGFKPGSVLKESVKN